MQRTRLTARLSPRKIDFDGENIYIIRSGVEEKIPFAAISYLAATSIRINNAWRFFKLKYKSATDGSEITVRFLPKGTASYPLPEGTFRYVIPEAIKFLQNSIKNKNPSADVSNTRFLGI